MVTIVRGTKRSHNGAMKVAACIASMSAFDLHRKTLILQVANNFSDISYELSGYVPSDEEETYGYENNTDETGIDALLARAATGAITDKQFDALILPISKERHELDVATRSNTDKIEYTVSENIQVLKQIIESAAGNTEADAPYDNVIILANGKNEELLEQIRSLADNEVICVGQNASELKGESVENPNVKRIIVVNDFSEESVYNIRFMRKEYKSKNVFILPYNILLSDATNSGRISTYITDNLSAVVSGINYSVIDSLRKINNFLFMEKKLEQDDSLNGIKKLSSKKESNESRVKLVVLPDGSVTVNETEIKRFLRKSYIAKDIGIDTQTLTEAEDVEYEEFGVNEQYLEEKESDLKRIERSAKKEEKKPEHLEIDKKREKKEKKEKLKQQKLEKKAEKKAKKQEKRDRRLLNKKRKNKASEERFLEEVIEDELEEQIIQTAITESEIDLQTDVEDIKDNDMSEKIEEEQKSAFTKEDTLESDKEYKDEKVIYLDEEIQVSDEKAAGESEYRADDLLDQMLGGR
jgi:hypothetical protein